MEGVEQPGQEVDRLGLNPGAEALLGGVRDRLDELVGGHGALEVARGPDASHHLPERVNLQSKNIQHAAEQHIDYAGKGGREGG